MDKKQLILNAAMRLFVEQGFHDTPTSKIAKEAGIAPQKMTWSRHFTLISKPKWGVV